MNLEERMKVGMLYRESGHVSDEDKKYEKLIETQRKLCKEMIFDYNQTRPSDVQAKSKILKDLLGDMGINAWIESPVHMAYGSNVHIGDNFYANFNLVLVDDIDIHIGNHVMIAPNVTLTTTGHPVHAEYRREGTQFSLPIIIGDDVWIGSNVVIMPGVTIDKNSVIGAGSVVTRDIPENVVAFGTPCRVVREISLADKEYYYRDRKVNHDFRSNE